MCSSPFRSASRLTRACCHADLEIAIQWGFITLFVVAFPLAPAIALVASYVELRIDTFKVLHLTTRPMPEGAQGTLLLTGLHMPARNTLPQKVHTRARFMPCRHWRVAAFL